MARQWKGKCIQCGKSFSYADHLVLRNTSLGRPRRILCHKCEKLEERELKATAVTEVLLQSNGKQVSTIMGQLESKKEIHSLDTPPSKLIRDEFGITDGEIRDLYNELSREDTPVVIAVAPTGSGKSTFLPYRLLVPDSLPNETFTQGRQIVITQPRRGATIGIASYVAGTLHAADVGIDHEIGYRVSGEHACDWRNRMVYVTDGTLVNWIVQGELDKISLIIIDEAHERSLNIDVILGLLTNALPQYPHLKMLIVSATIDHEKFRRFFDERLPSNKRCGVIECSGKKLSGLQIHWRSPSSGVFPFQEGPLPEFGKEVWKHLADAIVRLVVEMDTPSGSLPQALQEGDVLGFLHGAKPIDDACSRIQERLKNEYPRLAQKTDVYPFYAAVDENIQKKAKDKKKDPSRLRIVIASNAAETSLTIEGLVHVIDSGFIKQTEWNPILEQAPLLPIAHSQAGCRQRWGRVGRKEEGFAWSIYTKEQFEQVFPRDTKPDIQRARLDEVILKAKRGGADRINGDVFPWLDAPDIEEIKRSEERLRRQGAIDKDGDLTNAGVEAALSGGDEALFARIIADADRFGLGIEIATLLPFIKVGLGDILPDDRNLATEERLVIRNAQDRLRGGCADDLELCLRIYQDWVSLKPPPQISTEEAPPPPKSKMALLTQGSEQNVEGIIPAVKKPPSVEKLRQDFASRFGVDTSVLHSIVSERKDLIRKLGAKKGELEDREIDFAGLDRLRILLARAYPEYIYRKISVSESNNGEDVRYEQINNNDASQSPLLGIDSVSSCRAQQQPPEVLLALGPKQQKPSAPDSKERALLFAPFIIRIDPDYLGNVIDLPDIALADWFREKLPRLVRGSEKDHHQKMHEALRRDYPLGTLVQCRVRSDVEDNIEIEVLKAVGWGGERLKKIVKSDGRKEKLLDQMERDFDPRYTSKGSARTGLHIQKLEEDDFDLIDDTILADTERDSRPSRNLAAESEHDLDGTGFLVFGRLQQFGEPVSYDKGDIIVAEVTRHEAWRAQPRIFVATPPSRQRFQEFRKLYHPGSQIEVEVIGPTPSGSLQRGLQVREKITGLDALVPVEKLAIFSEPVLLKTVPIGANISLWIESINDRNQEVTLMNFPKLEAYLRRYPPVNNDENANDEVHAASVVFLDYDERHIYVIVLLDDSRTAEGLVIPAKVRLDRDLFEANGVLKLPYRVGDKVHVNVWIRSKGKSRSPIPRLSQQEVDVLNNIGIAYSGSQLSCQERISVTSYQKLLQITETPELGIALQELFLSSNEIIGDRIITDLELRFPVGKNVNGTVIRVNWGSAKLALQDEIEGRIARDEISWWGTERKRGTDSFLVVGEKVVGKVLSVDVSNQIVHLSLRQAQSATKGEALMKVYPPSKTVEGLVVEVKEKIAFVMLEVGLDGRILIRDMRVFNKGKYVGSAGELLKKNDKVRVRVTKIENEQIYLELIAHLGNARVEKEKKLTETEEEELSLPAEPLSWDDPLWPWTEGENAIVERKRPVPPELPKPPKRIPLEKRSDPTSWTINL